MENIELKLNQWNDQLLKLSHLENYCKIEVIGLEDNNIYYHPKFILSETASISSQCDINNKYIYAHRFNISEPEYFSIDIPEQLVDSIIVGYSTNKELVMVALSTLNKVRDHINNLESYTQDYISNILIGNSLEDLTNSFINELRSTNKIISFMKNSNKNGI